MVCHHGQELHLLLEAREVHTYHTLGRTSLLVDKWMDNSHHLFLNTNPNLFSRPFKLKESAKNMIPYLSSIPNH